MLNVQLYCYPKGIIPLSTFSLCAQTLTITSCLSQDYSLVYFPASASPDRYLGGSLGPGKQQNQVPLQSGLRRLQGTKTQAVLILLQCVSWKKTRIFSCYLRDSHKPHVCFSSQKHDCAAVPAMLRMSRLCSLLCVCFLFLENFHVTFTLPCVVPSPFVIYHY